MKLNVMGTMQDIIKLKKRLYKRRNMILEAAVVIDGLSYAGVIENISEEGLHLIVATQDRSTRFIPDTCIRLNFEALSGERINLNCQVRWVHINKTPVYNLIFRMGLNIIGEIDVI